MCHHVSVVAQMAGLLQVFWFDNTAGLRKMSARVRTSEICQHSRHQRQIHLRKLPLEKKERKKNTQVDLTQTRQMPPTRGLRLCGSTCNL